MSTPGHTLYFDGACKGNPGVGGAGWVLVENESGAKIGWGSVYLADRTTTNNVAEYIGECVYTYAN